METFLNRTPGLRELRSRIRDTIEKRGYLIGLDGRPLTIRKEHAALNTLLQSAGAILCKRWIVECERKLQDLGLSHGWDGDYCLVAWVHDEQEWACRTPETAEIVKLVAIETAVGVGRIYGFRCPLTADARIGKTWAEVH